MNMSAEVFENPHEFIPDRWATKSNHQRQAMERQNFSFGRGRRPCFGKAFALLSLKAAVCALVDRFALSIDPTAPGMVAEQAFGLRPKDNLQWVRLDPAPPSDEEGEKYH